MFLMKNQTLKTFLMEKRDTTNCLMKKAVITNFFTEKKKKKTFVVLHSKQTLKFTFACDLMLNVM